jgi:D-beta-D-heptose 7-phosphate kinase / D-beta-D-heptose 1-phosphate adenosyltransferase
LSQITEARYTVVTLGEAGAVMMYGDQVIHRPMESFIKAPNVIGAGDTFISAITLSLLSDAPGETALKLANAAAAIAVQKEGTSVCFNAELKAELSGKEKQIKSLEELAQVCGYYRAKGMKIVFTNGCFDILHSGHVSYLNRARKLGDVLIVGINTDESIKRIKGTSRPINTLTDRRQVLAGLAAIDHIISFGDVLDDTPVSLIRIVQPHVFAKGGDYTREKLPEAETVEKAGGEIVFLPLVEDHSTTQIIQQIYKTSTLAVA